MPEKFLKDVVVVDLGGRPAVSACGSLLAQLGATVVIVEEVREKADSPHRQWMQRALCAAGKLSVQIDPAARDDAVFLKSLLHKADSILFTRDELSVWKREAMPEEGGGTLLCDITSFGRTGPLAGSVYPELPIQAITGLMDTTGEADGIPTACRFPLVEYVAALYAVIGVLASLRVRRHQHMARKSKSPCTTVL